MKIFIHIGVHKTGTSALQQFLYQNQGPLLTLRALYHVPWPGHNNHHKLAVQLRRSESTLPQATEFCAQMLRLAEENKCHTVIVSSEVFAESRTDIPQLQSVFAENDLHIVAYLRRPDEMLVSAYNQLVREYKVRRTSPILADPAPYDLTYKTSLSDWISAFSPGQLVLCPFDREQMRDNNLFADFLCQVGLNINNTFATDVPAQYANKSWPAPLIELLRLSNFTPLEETAHREFASHLFHIWTEHRDFYASAPILTERQTSESYATMATSIEKLRPYFRSGFRSEFLTVPPPARHGAIDPIDLTVNPPYSELLVPLISEIHELKAEIKALRSKLTERKGKA